VYGSTHSWPLQLLQLSGQLHAPTVQPLREEGLWYKLDRRLAEPKTDPQGTHWTTGWVSHRTSLDDAKRREILSLPGFKLRHPVHILEWSNSWLLNSCNRLHGWDAWQCKYIFFKYIFLMTDTHVNCVNIFISIRGYVMWELWWTKRNWSRFSPLQIPILLISSHSVIIQYKKAMYSRYSELRWIIKFKRASISRNVLLTKLRDQ
jgi:hypothetical protein